MTVETATAPTVLAETPGRWERANKATLAMLGVTVVLFLVFGVAAPNFLTSATSRTWPPRWRSL
jgi:simple sugar transport system permease protein